MNSAPPTRPDEGTTEAAGSATPEWERFMRAVRQAAEEAWATGRRYYEVNFLALDRTPKWARQEDVAGAIEAIEGVGWKLEHVGYVNVSGTGQASGVLDSASLRVQGFYLFHRPE